VLRSTARAEQGSEARATRASRTPAKAEAAVPEAKPLKGAKAAKADKPGKARGKSAKVSTDHAELATNEVVVQSPVETSFPTDFVLSALELSLDDGGWAHLSTFGNYLTKLQPDFDARLYGYRKLSDLVRARSDLFVTEERSMPGSAQKVLYLRAR
jgi:hypothetical protein